MLKLRSSFPVSSNRRPIVIPHSVLPRAKRDHRFDRKSHTRAHDGAVACVVVVKHLNVGVELLANAVANERPHDAQLVLFCSRLDGLADIAERPARNNSLNAAPNTFFGHGNEVAVLVVNFSNGKRCVGVSMHATHVASDIKVDDVAIKQHSRIGNAVTNHFVH